jgi:hypothetical protein
MAYPYKPGRTDDTVSTDQTREVVLPNHTGDVSPVEETSPLPLRRPSASPHEEVPEKMARTASIHECLKS